MGDRSGLSLRIGWSIGRSADSTRPDKGTRLGGLIVLRIPHRNRCRFHLATQVVRVTRFALAVTLRYFLGCFSVIPTPPTAGETENQIIPVFESLLSPFSDLICTDSDSTICGLLL